MPSWGGWAGGRLTDVCERQYGAPSNGSEAFLFRTEDSPRMQRPPSKVLTDPRRGLSPVPGVPCTAGTQTPRHI